jgi:hypothetical protein
MTDPKRFMIRMTVSAAAAVILVTGSGCGRTLPVIDAETLSSKKSILVLVGESVSEQEAAVIRQAAAEKAEKDKISMEFVVKTSTNREDLSSTIGTGKYDGVIAAGNELFAPLSGLAQSVPEERFVLLGNGLSSPTLENGAPANLFVKKLDESKKASLWNEWVLLQKASGLNVLWISSTASPLPADWVPSEEADRLLQIDIYPGDTWFPQLSYQATAVKANLIALYTPVDEAVLNKIRTLKLPVTDTVGGLSAQYNWGGIISDSISRSLASEWKGGEDYYMAEEASIKRK